MQLAENAYKSYHGHKGIVVLHIYNIKVWVPDKQSILQTKIKVWSLDYFEEYMRRGNK